MIKFLILVSFFAAEMCFANPIETTETTGTLTVKSELLNELEETSEDLDFDTEDELFFNQSNEESLVIDQEIEQIALDKKTTIPTANAKDTKSSGVKKQ